MKTKTIGIVGLGLMGGSLSLALQHTAQDYYFIGLDHNESHCDEALQLNLVNEITQDIDVLQKCDVIFLSIPVDGIIAISQNLKNLDASCTVIDLGSTKEIISTSIPQNIRKNFVTAHPMTGTEKFGPSAALDNLYTNKVVVLCDIELSGKHQQDVAIQLFTDIGMQLVYMGAKEHDRHAAFISHMPHALSYALANSVMKQEDNESILTLAGGGFKDMSRIAKSSPKMWEDIFRQNKTNVLKSIHTLQSELKRCEKMIENEEWTELNMWMDEANTLHDILD
ncbi:MAG: Prephenate and/or arogenate dehydrogenase (unknown specificity) (EC (EC [uncultured Sulfurovum sp.]|uniref:prephenate dehydrogenase n=1 Tax=uncultured Sulfurovum sp. TaxID=269237 RepID=A0A6S6TEM4_9BACT|nr:MAG: Prephenate and/or arogenate dehydrogenase (unknown specificity) (EC (EC [uncultured Sulfurovum sp.]